MAGYCEISYYCRFPWFLKNKRMECTNLVDPHQLLCPWFTVVFVLFCIYTPDNEFPRPIVNQGGGLFWILSDSNVSFFPGFFKYGSIVAKDWYLFTCCFYTYHVIKKGILIWFFFFFPTFEIVRQINALGRPDLFLPKTKSEIDISPFLKTQE